MNVTMLRGAGIFCALALSSGVFAQAVDESALEALDQATPAAPIGSEPAGAAELRAAMRRISFNPSDADAMADAGNASLALGDANAALNFFTRANALRPGNSRIVSGLATATVRTENPFEALRLFDQAVRLGASERSIALDRALAFDLLGNFGRAQQDYKLARTASISDDLIIRQSVSLSLAGQKEAADAMLVPLLQRNSASAWRARAFMLAARGELRESSRVAQGFMDASSALRMEGFFRLMPSLTPAQKAAAIHLGHFPTRQSVGRDSEQVRQIAAALPQVPVVSGDNRLIPSGAALGPKSTLARDSKNTPKPDVKRDQKAQDRTEIQTAVANIPEAQKLAKTDTSRPSTATARAKIEEKQTPRIASVSNNALPVPETARPLVRAALPRPASTPTPTPLPAQAKAIVAVEPQPNAPTITSAAKATADVSAVDAPPIAQAAAIASQTPETVPAAPVGSRSFDLSAIVQAIDIPESEQRPSQVPVDLKTLKPQAPKATAESVKVAKVDPKIAAKAKAERDHPARYWVQIATGSANALGFDYRKLIKTYSALLKGRSPYTSEWGRTDRLLVGPFPDLKAAKKWEGDYKKAGGDAFMWKSQVGEVVNPLKTK
jgi:Flp pilus assembly protein TadD